MSGRARVGTLARAAEDRVVRLQLGGDSRVDPVRRRAFALHALPGQVDALQAPVDGAADDHRERGPDFVRDARDYPAALREAEQADPGRRAERGAHARHRGDRFGGPVLHRLREPVAAALADALLVPREHADVGVEQAVDERQVRVFREAVARPVAMDQQRDRRVGHAGRQDQRARQLGAARTERQRRRARAPVQFEVGQAAQRVGAERDEWHQHHGDHDADDGRSFQLFALGSAA
ncbi:hypothetical protein [Burkholderia ubonensis]|uniref:hypothetical protein n=1 Tax=Burkholderia ubonensis TaxID=101571 RepID=UPI001E526CF2|nr:hypothetical protein [Burkholderia ubonensis]